MEMPLVSKPTSFLLPLTIQKLKPPIPPPSTFTKTPQNPSPQRQNKHQKYPSFTPNNHLCLDQAKQLHAHIIRTHFNHAQQVSFSPFESHLSPEARYNLLITSYIRNNKPRYALNTYTYMRKLDIEVDSFIIPSVLKACSQVSVAQVGKEIHGFSVKNGFVSDVFVVNALMQTYTECNSIVSARLLFDKTSERDVVSWSTMIRAYSRNKLFNEGLKLIENMHFSNVKPSEVAMISMVNLFSDLENVEMGKAMHGYVIRNSNSEKTVVPLTTYHAFQLFVQMRDSGVRPNELTMVSLLSLCAENGALDMGKWFHAYIDKQGFEPNRFQLSIGFLIYSRMVAKVTSVSA
ncbi:hypothetical protein SADUNF_Sadunf13G0036700 [Salix dunnii]|uniref:Pentatricopeptide repeat-containing protein n=1 Tax=Salix dunnii TaxID=1413687 RepID=A0A835MKQ0_9ROSI|nr:hypothetical protein SADUNF_Sadunf13G0036700 [Salix dunnii]